MATWYAMRDGYLEYMRCLGRSSLSLKSARLWLDRFIEFCEAAGVPCPAVPSRLDLEKYRERLCWEPGPNGQIYGQRTVDIALRTVRGFFTWAKA